MNNLKQEDSGQILQLRLSNAAMAQLQATAERYHLKPDEVARLGISLAKMALEVRESGQKLVVATTAGVPVKDVILPE